MIRLVNASNRQSNQVIMEGNCKNVIESKGLLSGPFQPIEISSFVHKGDLSSPTLASLPWRSSKCNLEVSSLPSIPHQPLSFSTIVTGINKSYLPARQSKISFYLGDAPRDAPSFRFYDCLLQEGTRRNVCTS